MSEKDTKDLIDLADKEDDDTCKHGNSLNSTCSVCDEQQLRDVWVCSICNEEFVLEGGIE